MAPSRSSGRRAGNRLPRSSYGFALACVAVLVVIFLTVLICVYAVAALRLRTRRSSRERIENMLARIGADVRIDGQRPWDMRVLDDDSEDMFARVAATGNLALGEAYMDGRWTTERLDVMFAKLLRARADAENKGGWRLQALRVRHAVGNLQSPVRAWEVGERHYDVGNDLFAAMLDRRMTYTCGYWERAADLDSAQEDKLELTCRKIGLHENRGGMRVLDIGCGWGSFMFYAAEKYDARVVGATVSREQVRMGREHARASGEKRVAFLLADYRELLREDGHRETYDAVVSLGMFEHVGEKNYDDFVRVAHACLRPRGLLLLHTIGAPERGGIPDQWIRKYVFPNGQLPLLSQIATACEAPRRRLVIEDVHNFGPSYDRTLMAWNANFQRAWRDDAQLRERYGPRFKRMWEYYLQTCAAAFRVRALQLYQCVISKGGVPPPGYARPTLLPAPERAALR